MQKLVWCQRRAIGRKYFTHIARNTALFALFPSRKRVRGASWIHWCLLITYSNQKPISRSMGGKCSQILRSNEHWNYLGNEKLFRVKLVQRSGALWDSDTFCNKYLWLLFFIKQNRCSNNRLWIVEHLNSNIKLFNMESTLGSILCRPGFLCKC